MKIDLPDGAIESCGGPTIAISRKVFFALRPVLRATARIRRQTRFRFVFVNAGRARDCGRRSKLRFAMSRAAPPTRSKNRSARDRPLHCRAPNAAALPYKVA